MCSTVSWNYLKATNNGIITTNCLKNRTHTQNTQHITHTKHKEYCVEENNRVIGSDEKNSSVGISSNGEKKPLKYKEE